MEVDLVEFRPSQRKQNDFSKLFLSLTPKPQQEWLDLFRNPPVELRMSSVRRLLIFHASIGTEHVQTGAHLFFLPALVWLHLTFCEIRTRFNSCSAEQRLGERRQTERVAEKRLMRGGDDCVVCSISASSPL